ncbi:glycoside hydrolase [Epithele typhae]|uniref:glycoside hydrolase n=1 Tax=Epithele typhae TaxID=378194 RepID=UPI00200880BB|nr:glycoside hydrolase [Epithele typhae]XP_047880805.1 glycoside hydrolase [Epithele typhae]KAH9930546.1 glycoside hydrolase [Epithele typhae]KAH9941085.1 glycoside hydrolase [Epithele typhae]
MCSLKPPKSASASAASSTGTASTGNNASGSSNGTLPDDVVASTWYAGWHGTDFPPDQLSWSKYTSVTYSFAETTNDVNTLSLEGSNPDLLPTFVGLAHQNGVKAMLTVGGWSGSQYFSTAVATEANRTAFVKTCTDLISKYNLDGLDFDWEYPNKQGVGCNTIDADDSANFLSFLQALRTEVGQNFTISAAAGITPFAGTDGSPMSDVSAFAEVLDWVAIMNYDIWGSWSTSAGPNAPLNDTCAPAADQQGSAVSAVAAWTKAGFPASQLVLGVASYGHSFAVSASNAFAGADDTTLASYPAFDASSQPLGDEWDEVAPAGKDQCGNATPGGPSGIWDFFGLIDGGLLTANGTAADGVPYRYDECSQTPYVYDVSRNALIAYDDTTSFAAKGNFINNMGMLGFAMWEAAGDKDDLLLDAISDAMGIVDVSC